MDGSSTQSQTQTTETGPEAAPEAWLQQHGEAMYRYALARVRRPEVAEELVQEALLAAWRGAERFQGDSQERTWLIGILRHKVLDHLRKRSPGEAGAEDLTHADWLADLFDDQGRWRQSPDPNAARPEILAQHREFWEVLDECLDDLPPRHREAFVRRVMDHEEAKSVREAMKVSMSNLHVMLYRARTQLRRCLMHRWFQEGQ